MLTISLHESGRELFPGTGFPADIGGPDALGSAVNVRFPGPSVGGNTETQPKLVGMILGAFAPALPDRVMAAEGVTSCNFLFGGIDPRTGAQYAHYHFEASGWGGRLAHDGNSAQNHIHGNCRNTPVEVFETRFPFLVGYYVGLATPPDYGRLVHLMIGTLLAAGGTLALNQYLEREVVTDPKGRKWSVALMDVLGQEGDPDRPNDLLALEYSQGRYFTVTGAHVVGTPTSRVARVRPAVCSECAASKPGRPSITSAAPARKP